MNTEEILKDPKRLNAQFCGTKDYIIDTCANRLIMTACQVFLGHHPFEKENLESIKEDLEKFDEADRYILKKYRDQMFDIFKNQSLPDLIKNFKNIASSGKLKPELWSPVLSLFFEKAKVYLSFENN